MKYIISRSQLTNPTQGHSHFLHNFWSSYEYIIHYQSGDSRALLNGHMGPPPYVAY